MSQALEVSATGLPALDPVILRVEGMRKVYPGTLALDNVDFQVRRGKVNVLVGENGAGKSTLMKILAGVEQPSAGRILLDGEEIRYASPRDALAHGIGIVYQEMNLFPNLSVAENLFANREKLKHPGWIDHPFEERKAAELMLRLNQDIEPRTLVRDLKVGQQQIVEIAKALVEDASILIMDEPTAALSKSEVEVLFGIIAELKAKGVSIIYISHRMDELMRIGDFITVLRDGRLIDQSPMEKIDLHWIVKTMIGEDTDKVFRGGQHPIGATVLEVKDLRLPSATGRMTLDGISFELRKGEVLGLFGLMGAGRTEVLETIMGLHRNATGEVLLEGRDLAMDDIQRRIKKGISLVPEDRQREGIIQTMSVASNMTLSGLWRIVSRGFHIGRRIELGQVQKMIGQMSIKTPRTDTPITSLSGGNQQKVIIGKNLLTRPKVLLLDEPTRGIDVGAKGEVFEIVNALAAEGIGVLFVSSELMEIRAISDRIIVLSRGTISGEFLRKDATEENLVAASAKTHL
jgi:erythritol transport system ATP-binding protein